MAKKKTEKNASEEAAAAIHAVHDDTDRAHPGAVLSGDAEAEPVVESHKDK